MSLETIFSVVVGGAITSGVSAWFYVRAARDLRAETAAVRGKVDSVLYGLEEAGIVRLSKNEAGEIKGVLITVGQSLEARWNVEANDQDAPDA